MIYVFTATYQEASTWIAYFRLKKDMGQKRFQVFGRKEGDICLTITGVGMISAASAVSSICTAYGAGKGDFLINAGICAAVGAGHDAVGKLFLCNKITELTTGKTFYPDVLFHHDFSEAELWTGVRPLSAAGDFSESVFSSDLKGFFLYDMEASAIYQAGSYFFGPHQMAFLKIVSDLGDVDSVTPERVKRWIERHIESMAGYVGQLCEIGCREQREDFMPEDAVERLCRDMCCSASMEASVRQHIRYCALAGVDYESRIRKLYQESVLPCRNKREGKRCFEELKRRLL